MKSAPEKFGKVEKLTPSHSLDAFDCGKEPLNRFLKRFALTSQKSGSVQTYVVCGGGRHVVGYYSLCVGAVEYVEVPMRVAKGLARHPVPVMILARLAVDRSKQKIGLGKGLLKDALLRTMQAAEIAGIRAFLVHAKDEEARLFYASFGFEPSPTDTYHLFLLMKDLRQLVSY